MRTFSPALQYADLQNNFDTTRDLIGYITVLDESMLNTDVCITSPTFVSPADFTKHENLFPCNIASSKHLNGKLVEHSSSVRKPLGCASRFPNATRVLPTSRVFR